MSRVCVEETAAIRAQHLDGKLRSQGALSDRLARTFQSLDCLIRFEVLNATLRNKKQSGENTNWKQDVERPTSDINPEISYGLRGVPCESANQRNGHGHSRRRGDKVLNGQGSHLDEIADGSLRSIGLPIRIGHEADGGIEGQVGGHRRGV